MELGGAETSLLGLLDQFDYDNYDVDLFLYRKEGVLLPLINKNVRILDENKKYSALTEGIAANLKSGFIGIGLARIFAKIRSKLSIGPLKYPHNYKQYFHKLCMPFLPSIPQRYDLAISFNDPHFVIGKKVCANIKMSWFHTDASKIEFCKNLEKDMWEMSDYVVNVSEKCKREFDMKHPYLNIKSIVVENILSKRFIIEQSERINCEKEIKKGDKSICLLSVGRFTEAKNFDNVPEICKMIRNQGLDVRWYIIGYGSDEQLIKNKIKEFGMQEYVILLGMKDNPYPYIKACDIYVQPSRYEGKCVAVREAQILNKPVIITNYTTSANQLRDGFDGVVVPMDNRGCADGIVRIIKNNMLRQYLIENTRISDYTNASEVEKIYSLI